jgi:hypothetical protein
MGRPALEVADIFRAHGPAWRQTQTGHLSLGQLKVMSAIEQCRTAALGGHVLRCDSCDTVEVSYNSCRNRHCPKCQAKAAQRWLDARQADLLPVEYYHVVFTLPAPISALAYTNKAVIYRLLFDVAAETLATIAADPKHLGAQIGITLVLHTWGSAMTHHPHVHGIVPGGGLSPDGKRWVACKPGSFCRSACSRGCSAGAFSKNSRSSIVPGSYASSVSTPALANTTAFAAGWHRCANANGWSMPSAPSPDRRRCWRTCPVIPTAWRSRTGDWSPWMAQAVTFRWKDYRAKGSTRPKTMTLAADEFMRRFLSACPAQRIPPHPSLWIARQCRPQGASGQGARTAQCTASRIAVAAHELPVAPSFVCRCCGAAMRVIETFLRGQPIRAPPEGDT